MNCIFLSDRSEFFSLIWSISLLSQVGIICVDSFLPLRSYVSRCCCYSSVSAGLHNCRQIACVGFSRGWSRRRLLLCMLRAAVFLGFWVVKELLWGIELGVRARVIVGEGGRGRRRRRRRRQRSEMPNSKRRIMSWRSWRAMKRAFNGILGLPVCSFFFMVVGLRAPENIPHLLQVIKPQMGCS